MNSVTRKDLGMLLGGTRLPLTYLSFAENNALEASEGDFAFLAGRLASNLGFGLDDLRGLDLAAPECAAAIVKHLRSLLDVEYADVTALAEDGDGQGVLNALRGYNEAAGPVVQLERQRARRRAVRGCRTLAGAYG